MRNIMDVIRYEAARAFLANPESETIAGDFVTWIVREYPEDKAKLRATIATLLERLDRAL